MSCKDLSSGRQGKKEGRGKFEYLENKKIYLGEIKSVSHSF